MNTIKNSMPVDVSPKVAFQGAHYAFSEIAAFKFFGSAIETLPLRGFEDVYDNVNNSDARYGLVPIENSLTGSIHRNYDLLLQHQLFIVGEVYLRVAQHLIAHPGVQLSDIEVIYSHPQALEQCRNFINSLHQVEAIASYDTAGSVRMIRAKNLKNAAAIGSREAAEDYGMQILHAEIADDSENFTRFLVLSKVQEQLAEPNKTSIVFSMQNIPGALFKALSVFALRDIDLLKIESRPLRGRPWNYFFYLDFDGSMDQEKCQNAIRHLREITIFLRVLGSYPSGRQAHTNGIDLEKMNS